jgi:hypothetical protein
MQKKNTPRRKLKNRYIKGGPKPALGILALQSSDIRRPNHIEYDVELVTQRLVRLEGVGAQWEARLAREQRLPCLEHGQVRGSMHVDAHDCLAVLTIIQDMNTLTTSTAVSSMVPIFHKQTENCLEYHNRRFSGM